MQLVLKELCEPRRLNNSLNPGAENMKPGSEEDFRERVHQQVSVRLENDYLICFEMAHSFSLEYSP